MAAADQADAQLPAKTKVGGDFLEGLSSLNFLRQVGLMVTLAASVAAGVAVVMWLWSDDYRPLYGRMDNLDAANVVDVLEQNNIKYKMDPNSGAILVAADDVHMARLKLAEFGLPNSPIQGFELMDKEQPLGTSQFIENARYQRSIEGELARTITSITSIRSARVHLALPKKTVFVRDSSKPTASVFVEVFAGRSVDPAQVKAIMNLVASSVPEMKMDDVTVVDQHGNLLSVTGEDGADVLLAAKQHKYTKEVEDSVVKRINGILEPVVGGGNFRAQVSADVDFTAVEQAAETFNPDLPAVRSEQTLNESRTGNSAAEGIPGALTNQPPGTAQAPEQANAQNGQAAAATPSNKREQTTRNYELDRTVSYTKHQQGTIKRLTVAVVVDDKLVKDADGNETHVPWSDAELERLSILVRDAVGYSAVRGDSVNVLNSPFSNRTEDTQTTGVETPWWQEWIIPNIKYIAGVLVFLLLIFGVFRPMFKSLSRTGGSIAEEEEARQLAALEAAGGVPGMEGMSDETVTLTGGGNAFMLPGPEQGYEEQVNAIKGLIADDPGRVAQVVKKWVNRDD